MNKITSLKNSIERIKQHIPKEDPEVIIRMWVPGGKAPEYKGGGIKIEPSTEEEYSKVVR